MAVKRPKSAGAFTLIEVIAAILILSIAVLGTSGYRYYAALDARKATMHTTAAGIGLLLCESWRRLSDQNTFDPEACFSMKYYRRQVQHLTLASRIKNQKLLGFDGFLEYALINKAGKRGNERQVFTAHFELLARPILFGI